MLSRMKVITSAATNRMEFTGVRNRGWSRVSRCGTRWSHPAASGRRVIPVKSRLAAATARAISRKMPNGAAHDAEPNAARKVWGIGPMTLMG